MNKHYSSKLKVVKKGNSSSSTKNVFDPIIADLLEGIDEEDLTDAPYSSDDVVYNTETSNFTLIETPLN